MSVVLNKESAWTLLVVVSNSLLADLLPLLWWGIGGRACSGRRSNFTCACSDEVETK